MILTAAQNIEKDRVFAELDEDLPELERRGLRAAHNLKLVKEQKFYLPEFKTFEACMEVRFGFSRRRAYQLIDYAAIVEKLPPKVAKQITNERQARAISDVPAENRVEVLEHAAAKSEPLTAASIKCSASGLLDRSTARPEADIDRKYVDNIGRCIDDSGVRDPTGWDIPYWLVPVMDKTSEFAKKIVRDVSTAKTGITSILEHREEHPEFNECRDLQKYQIELEECYVDLKRSIPYAVCLYCLGKQAKTCLVCHQNGWISEFAWKHSRTDMKEMRAKVIVDNARKVA